MVQPDGRFWAVQSKTGMVLPDGLFSRRFPAIFLKFFFRNVWLIGSADITFAAPNEQEVIITKSFRRGLLK